MHRLENSGSMRTARPGQMFFRDPPQRFVWMAPMTEHRCLAILGIRKKRRRLDPDGIELAGRREEPCEVFLVGDDVSQT